MSGSSSVTEATGEAAAWVEALTYCPHLPSAPLTSPFPAIDSPCSRCNDLNENWTCLTCKDTLCGRYINGHMLAHSQSSDHALAMSFRDLSAWCFKCDAYLDAQVIPLLRPAFETLYQMKFGELPPPRETVVPTLTVEAIGSSSSS